MTGSSVRTRGLVAVLLTATVVGCVASPGASRPAGTAGGGPSSSGSPADSIPPATPVVPSSTAVPTEDAGGTGTPPVAELRVEGGDPVPGDLGTYVWDAGGSDSPWLPGEPMEAAAGEVLSVTLVPDVPPTAWSARIAPAASGDGTGAVDAGHGSGPVAIAVEAPGTWTLAVTISFGDRGTATWFWRLDVV